MKNIVKYSGLILVAVVLVFANTMMIYKTFFAKSRLDPSYKQPAVVTDDDIRRYADSVFTHKDSLRVVEDEIMSNKRIIIENGDTLGFAFIVYEPIPCPSCSDVNYVLITDKEYIIMDIRFLKEIIEGYEVINMDTVIMYSQQFISLTIVYSDISSIKPLEKPKKYSEYFINTLITLQKQIILFYGS